MLSPAHLPRTLQARTLIDSGSTTLAFVDRDWATEHGIPTGATMFPRRVVLADGTVSDVVTRYFTALMKIGHHVEEAVFLVTKLGRDTPLILGLPWLKLHDCSTHWAAMTLSFQSHYCRQHCLPKGLPAFLAKAPPAPPLPAAATRLSSTNYRPPSVEDHDNTSVEDHDNICQNNEADQPCPKGDVEGLSDSVARRDKGHQQPDRECKHHVIKTHAPRQPDLDPADKNAPISAHDGEADASPTPERRSSHEASVNSPIKNDNTMRNYRPPSVEDCQENHDDEPPNDADAPELPIEPYLDPDRPWYRTYNKSSEHGGPEVRAIMIKSRPTRGTLIPGRVAGQQRRLPLPARKMPPPRHNLPAPSHGGLAAPESG